MSPRKARSAPPATPGCRRFPARSACWRTPSARSWGNIVLIYFGAGLALVFSIVPALLVEEPRVLAHAETGTPTEKMRIGALLLLMRPLWAFAVYAMIAMGLKIAGVKTHSLWLEVVFACWRWR